ncbi:MAG: hypothetical protein AAB289_08300 [Chloroflexota bacterium]
MARIVVGAATSRTAMLSIPPDLWPVMGQGDRQGRPLRDRTGRLQTFEEALSLAGPAVAAEITPEANVRKHAAAVAALDRLADALEQADPDVIVQMGDDEEENIHGGNQPSIAVFHGPSFPLKPVIAGPEKDAVSRASAWSFGAIERDYPVPVDLAVHLASYLMDAEFDIASSNALPAGAGMAHGFSFMFKRLMRERPVPIVPLILNTHYPPNQIAPRRAYNLGRAVKSAVEAWPHDLRVAVVATGGMSIGLVDAEMDRHLLDSLQRRDTSAIFSLPRKWLEGRTGESYTFIATGGAAEHLTMDWQYFPGYRSPAGTGCGLGFALWR